MLPGETAEVAGVTSESFPGSIPRGILVRTSKEILCGVPGAVLSGTSVKIPSRNSNRKKICENPLEFDGTPLGISGKTHIKIPSGTLIEYATLTSSWIRFVWVEKLFNFQNIILTRRAKFGI